MTEALYREVRESEMPEAVELFLASVEDMYARHRINAPLPPRAMIEKFYEHIRRTGIFQVAEVEGRLGAICHAIVRGSQWFLSGFWTLPAWQGQSVGHPLLKRVWDEGARLGAETFFTWSSVDMQAMAIYMKMGMLPGYQILVFAGAYANQGEGERAYETRALEFGTALRIDEQVRGTPREIDHRFNLEEFKAEGREVLRDGRTVGYYYFTDGHLGSAAWLDSEDATGVLACACREASAGAGQIRFVALGVNHAAIRFALHARLRLVSYSHLLTTATFGQLEKYLPSGPSLF